MACDLNSRFQVLSNLQDSNCGHYGSLAYAYLSRTAVSRKQVNCDERERGMIGVPNFLDQKREKKLRVNVGQK